MEYAEFRRHLGKAGVTVNEFAAFVEVRPNSISNYSKKNVVPAEYAVIAVLIGDAADRGIDFREILSRFGARGRILDRAGSNVSRIDDYRPTPKHK